MRRLEQGFRTVAILTAMLTSARYMEGAEMDMTRSDRLAGIVDQNVNRIVTAFSGTQLKSEEIALTLVDLENGELQTYASHRGGERIYPASVVKLFYLEAAHRWMDARVRRARRRRCRRCR